MGKVQTSTSGQDQSGSGVQSTNRVWKPRTRKDLGLGTACRQSARRTVTKGLIYENPYSKSGLDRPLQVCKLCSRTMLAPELSAALGCGYGVSVSSLIMPVVHNALSRRDSPKYSRTKNIKPWSEAQASKPTALQAARRPNNTESHCAKQTAQRRARCTRKCHGCHTM
jgi:hypothetical protein